MTSESSVTTSCSDCKLEHIERRWTQLLLNWLNKCVHPNTPVTKLNNGSLLKVIYKYKQDICSDEVQKSFFNATDVEPFISYTYPLLQLKYIYDEADNEKLYIMTAVLLYHCCISSKNATVDSDIYINLNSSEQEMILKYCEVLMTMEVTVNNVHSAIRDACEAMNLVKSKRQSNSKIVPDRSLTIDSRESSQPMDAIMRPSLSDSLSNLSTSSTLCLSKKKKIRFDTSVTVLPSALTVTPSDTDDYEINYDSVVNVSSLPKVFKTTTSQSSFEETRVDDFMAQSNSIDPKPSCKPGCGCAECESRGTACGDAGKFTDSCLTHKKNEKTPYLDRFRSRSVGNVYLLLLAIFLIMIAIIAVLWHEPWKSKSEKKILERKTGYDASRTYYVNSKNYVCRNNICQIVYAKTAGKIYQSINRCILNCMGPQLWPHPIGLTFYNKKLVALATSKLEYKIQTVPSEAVHSYLAQAFKLFIEDLVHLEKSNMEFKDQNVTQINMPVRKINIQLHVELDPDPRIRVDTDETYNLKIDDIDNVLSIVITSPSFCGVRHGLETLSQLILADPTNGYLITLSNVVIRDAPSYKYRGLMIDTGRNYIPVPDLIRTIDAMATCKLNTFHWRISDVTSFPLLLPLLPQLFEYGGYDKSLVYKKNDVKSVVKRAAIRGIRVLIEVAAPGPVGRPWSWSPDASCPTKATNYTCNNYLCLRLSMRGSIMDALQTIYSEIIEMTKVEDIFHLSDSLSSLVNCYYLTEDREGFLDKALQRLKLANKGTLPKLPIIWYTKHLSEGIEAKCWDRLGVQLTEWQLNPSDRYLNRFKVIHSSRWDLSCEVTKHRCTKYRTWQNMYSWNSWRNIDVFATEGGESILWTDLVDSGAEDCYRLTITIAANLDVHLWPRAAAVAERLWSDMAINSSVSPSVYIRLDNYRWRLLRKSVKVQPIWPMYCSSNPEECLKQLRPQK